MGYELQASEEKVEPTEGVAAHRHVWVVLLPQISFGLRS